MIEQNKQRNLLAAAGATVTATSCILAEGGTDGVIGTDFGTEVHLIRSETYHCTDGGPFDKVKDLSLYG